ncbi:MAG: DNA translocase FtsK 4TM domain-containing protein, partial [Acidobacteriaceae bacterium]
IGLFGATLSDLMLQTLVLTAFLIPLWLGGLGWTWMHSRPGGLAWLRWTGTVLALVFVPAVFGLLPWRWLWLHALPVEGVVGSRTNRGSCRQRNRAGRGASPDGVILARFYRFQDSGQSGNGGCPAFRPAAARLPRYRDQVQHHRSDECSARSPA